MERKKRNKRNNVSKFLILFKNSLTRAMINWNLKEYPSYEYTLIVNYRVDEHLKRKIDMQM